jgi:hypothetical protein
MPSWNVGRFRNNAWCKINWTNVGPYFSLLHECWKKTFFIGRYRILFSFESYIIYFYQMFINKITEQKREAPSKRICTCHIIQNNDAKHKLLYLFNKHMLKRSVSKEILLNKSFDVQLMNEWNSWFVEQKIVSVIFLYVTKYFKIVYLIVCQWFLLIAI